MVKTNQELKELWHSMDGMSLETKLKAVYNQGFIDCKDEVVDMIDARIDDRNPLSKKVLPC